MIKHRDMLAIISKGEPFNCVYLKRVGQFTTFTGIKKHNSTGAQAAPAPTPLTHKKRRAAVEYDSLMPFVTANGEIRELYTRAIIKFNDEDVIL